MIAFNHKLVFSSISTTSTSNVGSNHPREKDHNQAWGATPIPSVGHIPYGLAYAPCEQQKEHSLGTRITPSFWRTWWSHPTDFIDRSFVLEEMVIPPNATFS